MNDIAHNQERYADKVWESERLVYRGVLETDRAWFEKSMRFDSLVLGISSPWQLLPMNPKTGDEFWNMCKECPIPVVVCLKPEEEARLAAEDAGAERLATADDKAVANGAGEPKKDDKDGKEPSLPAKEKALTRLGMVMLFNDGGEHGRRNRRAELGIFLARTVRGRGYGGEAIDWLLDRAFMDLNLHKVFLQAYEFNTRALKCYRRLGFREDGRLRDSIWFERRYWDIFNMSVLEDEWEAMRGYKSTTNGKTNGVANRT